MHPNFDKLLSLLNSPLSWPGWVPARDPQSDPRQPQNFGQGHLNQLSKMRVTDKGEYERVEHLFPTLSPNTDAECLAQDDGAALSSEPLQRAPD
ncbi:hypothetical protein DHEL01_v203977 [Diaporthe helianthi]|uniref:Uncharacterized protein n=1 Tax=Diaporthe helianthi TaxID=158607 RepID=A0A2P5I577_DIAHE|nr:hypothetical protein DHEL01_v203977 [Diaporthe helianthi]